MYYLFQDVTPLVDFYSDWVIGKQSTDMANNCCVVDKATNLIFVSKVIQYDKVGADNSLKHRLETKACGNETILGFIFKPNKELKLGDLINASFYKIQRKPLLKENLKAELDRPESLQKLCGSYNHPDKIFNYVLSKECQDSRGWNKDFYFKLVDKASNDFNEVLLFVEYQCTEDSLPILEEIFCDLYKGNTVRIVVNRHLLRITLEIILNRYMYDTQPLFTEVGGFILPTILLLRFNGEKSLEKLKDN
jgi:hypothetical protein